MIDQRVGERLRSLRVLRGLDQDDVTTMIGVNDRQTVSAIENGKRKLKASELVALVAGFEVPLDYFTDPFTLTEQMAFSWRRSEAADPIDVSEFEESVRRWIGLYLGLAEPAGMLPATLPTIGIDERSSWEDAEAAGERIAKRHFGERYPAFELAEKMTSELGVLVLMVDAFPGISGAACRLKDLRLVLVNRNEPPARRHFDLAHELFHILTWRELPPVHIDGTGTTKQQMRAESLADQFAAGLLMPKRLLDSPHGNLTDWLNRTATKFGVSSVAMKWRVKNLGMITDSQMGSLREEDLRHNGGLMPKTTLPPLLNAKFLKAVSEGFENGSVSVGKVIRTLGLDVDNLELLMDAHGIKRNFDL